MESDLCMEAAVPGVGDGVKVFPKVSVMEIKKRERRNEKNGGGTDVGVPPLTGHSDSLNTEDSAGKEGKD